MNNSATAAVGMSRAPFTASQWQELEHQALVFKYLMSGVPVPPDLLLRIRRSFDAVAASVYHHPTIGYCSFYGKKIDPEPGRCRRTDGKKWRCSKDAYGDSKYCERHMHKGRNRSRKPVESQTSLLSHISSSLSSPSSSSSSPVTSLNHSGVSDGGNMSGVGTRGGGGSTGIFQSGSALSSYYGTNPTQLQMDLASAMGNKDYRHVPGMKSGSEEHKFPVVLGNSMESGINSSLESGWSLVSSGLSSFDQSKARYGSVLPSRHTQLLSMQDTGHHFIGALSKQQQQQQSLSRTDFSSSELLEKESQSLQPFFDEWPKARYSWFNLEDEICNKKASSTTQLSISIPMASSDFPTTTSNSPTDD